MDVSCKKCNSTEVIRWGGKNNNQAWKCKKCGHYFCYGLKREKNDFLLVYNFALGYVIGVLKGDGCLTITKDYHYFNDSYKQVSKDQATKIIPRQRHTIALQCKDQDFAIAFQQELQSVTLKKVALHPVTHKTTVPRNNIRIPYVFHGFNVRLTSIEWFNKLLPISKNLTWITTANMEVKRGFLKGFFDSEGTTEKRPRVGCDNNDTQLLKIAQTLLKDFNIISYMSNPSKGIKCHRLWIGGKENVKKYAIIIGFSIERKNKKLWENGKI